MSPTVPQYFPGEQGKQLLAENSAENGENVPIGHGKGLEDPAGQKKPGGQVMGKIKPQPGQYSPCGQIEQFEFPTTML
jgi:hypothetical protein